MLSEAAVFRQMDWRLRKIEEEMEENAWEESRLRRASERREQALLSMTKIYNAAVQSRNTLYVVLGYSGRMGWD